MYVAADKYDVPALKDLAVAEFRDQLCLHAAAGERHILPLIQAMKVMYRETPETDRALKDIATDFVVKYADDILDWNAFESLCMDIGGIGLDVAKVLRRQKRRRRIKRFSDGYTAHHDDSGQIVRILPPDSAF